MGSKTIPNVCNYFLASIFLSAFSILLATISLNLSNCHESFNVKKCENKNLEHEQDFRSALTDALKRAGIGSVTGKKSSEDHNHNKVEIIETSLQKRGKQTKTRRFVKKMDLIFGILYIIASTLYTIIFLLTL